MTEKVRTAAPAAEKVNPKDHEMVLVEFDRSGYTRSGVAYSVGNSIEVPRYALPTILNARPPYGHVVTDEELAAATAPAANIKTTAKPAE